MPNKKHSIAILTFAGATLASAGAFAADVHLYPGQSFQQAVSRAQPGDRILMHAGVYQGGGWIGPVHGTAAAPIQVLSVDGPRTAVIQGGDEALRIGDASSYLVFDGLEVRNSGDNAIHIDGGSSYITLRNIYAHDAGLNGDVVKLNQSNHLTIENSEFARPGQRTGDAADNPYQECLDFVDVDDSVIRGNFFHDGGSMLMFVKGGSRNTIIERNVYANQRAGASDPAVGLGGPTDPWLLGGEQYEVINVVFRNNVITGGYTGGLAVYDANGAYIANNLFLNNNRVLIEFRAGNGPAGGSTDVRVVDNLFVDTRGQMPTPYVRSSHSLSNFTTASNSFWNNGGSVPTGGELNVTTQPGYLGSNPMVAACDPLGTRAAILGAVKPASGSSAASTAIDSTVSPFGVIDDVNAVARGTRRDRGPFVLAGGATTTTTSTSTTSTTPPTTTTTTTAPTTSPTTSTSTSTSCALPAGQTRLASNGTTVCAPHSSTIRVSSDCCDWMTGTCYRPSSTDLACGGSTSTSTSTSSTSTTTTSPTTTTTTTSPTTSTTTTTTSPTTSTSTSTSCALPAGQTRLASNGTTVCAPHSSTIRVSSDCCDWMTGTCYRPSSTDLACGGSTSTSTSTSSTSTTSTPTTGTTATTSTATTATATTSTGGTCPPEPTTLDAAGQPRNAAGQVRFCWPGEANCHCDSDNDCYANEQYVPCNAQRSDVAANDSSAAATANDPTSADDVQGGVGCDVGNTGRSNGIAGSLLMLAAVFGSTRLRRRRASA